MPKTADKGSRITYPDGCRELSEELGKDELLKRLKALARAFQDMGQDENNDYKDLSLFLASDFFMENPNKDVRLLVACCIADIFRIFAPDAPFTDSEHIKEIFLFITKQLKGLEDPETPSFKRYFYLLENLAWVKSFNICIELEDNQEIFCELYKLLFSIVNQNHSPKVLNFMLDMMSPLISEADNISQDLLDIILMHIIEPLKTNNKVAYNLSKDLIRRTANALEPYIQSFFNNALTLGKTSDSELSGRLFDLIYELNMIAPSVLLAVLPQLEFKLKSSDEKERRTVTKLLAKMFSDPDSQLAQQNKPLWVCFLGRFKDIDVAVRRTCVQITQEFIINHSDLVNDITEQLRNRGHDSDENVRMDVVQAIVAAAKRDYLSVTENLLTCVKERTLDKKYKLRKEALSGLGAIYKRVTLREDLSREQKELVAWVKNKVLHAYYQTTVDDRILVERILNMSLVPFSLEPEARMRRLLEVYAGVDEHAVKAFHELLKTQMNLRAVLRNLCELHIKSEKEDVSSLIQARIMTLAKNLPDPPKAQEYIRKFSSILRTDQRVRQTTLDLTAPDCQCANAEDFVKEILKKMGQAVPTNALYTNVKTLLERVAPVMIDLDAMTALVTLLDDAVNGLREINDDIPDVVSKGMKLLSLLSIIYPGAFQSEEIFTKLIAFVKNDDETVADTVLCVFASVGQKMEQNFPQVYSSLIPILQKMVKVGTPKQAKHAVRCISTVCRNRAAAIFKQIFTHSKKHLDPDSPHFLTSLVAVGHMTQLCPQEFANTVKTTVSTFIVKELLMQDKSQSRASNQEWCPDHMVSDETQSKVLALKLMMRWLLGLKSNENSSGTSTLRLFYTIIVHEGDLMERGQINKAEMARLRLCAGCCMLKLAQEHVYESCMTLDWFQALALLIVDPCYQVRSKFAQKLHKGLLALRLPLQYMSVFCLAASDPLKERRQHIKSYLTLNINKRREVLRTSSHANTKMFSVLPDYVLPYAIHLLAHDPDLQHHCDLEPLKAIKECLWFVMEPLISKNENYSYSFYRKLIENIKQTRDKQNPDDDVTNHKLYAVCDLALGLVMTKSTAYILKDFPADPVLPAKLFTNPDNTFSNTQIYLPEELRLQTHKGKKAVPVGHVLTTKAPIVTIQNPKSKSKSTSAAVRSPASSPDARHEASAKSPPAANRRRIASPTSPAGAARQQNLSSHNSSPMASSRPQRAVKRKAAPTPQSDSDDDDDMDASYESGDDDQGLIKRAAANYGSPSAASSSSRARDSCSSQSSPVKAPGAARGRGGASSKTATTQSKLTDYVTRTNKSPQNKENKPSSSADVNSSRASRAAGSSAQADAKQQQSARASKTNTKTAAAKTVDVNAKGTTRMAVTSPRKRAAPSSDDVSDEDAASLESGPVAKKRRPQAAAAGKAAASKAAANKTAANKTAASKAAANKTAASKATASKPTAVKQAATKATTKAAAPTRRATRRAESAAEESDEEATSDSRQVSSPIKPAASAATSTRRTRAKEIVPSPVSSPATSPSRPQQKVPSGGAAARKQVPTASPASPAPVTRRNIRRAGRMVNGTSDGDDTTTSPDTLTQSSSRRATQSSSLASSPARSSQASSKVSPARSGASSTAAKRRLRVASDVSSQDTSTQESQSSRRSSRKPVAKRR